MVYSLCIQLFLGLIGENSVCVLWREFTGGIQSDPYTSIQTWRIQGALIQSALYIEYSGCPSHGEFRKFPYMGVLYGELRVSLLWGGIQSVPYYGHFILWTFHKRLKDLL